ncbi:MAG: hypothetical protein R2821_03825 [Flavobacteriaceae bacterium]|nr:hypothetical protein [Ignavibacteriota bacterium]
MLISDIRVYSKANDGIICFRHNGILRKVIISKSNSLAKRIFDSYYEQLKLFKDRQYAIAKWIVRDMRKEGFIFISDRDNISIIKPYKITPDDYSFVKEKLSKIKEIERLLIKLDVINKKLYYNLLE